MTDPTIPDVTPEPEPEPGPGPGPTAPKKVTSWPWIAGIVAALFVGIGIGVAAAGGGGGDGAQTTTPDDVVETDEADESAAPAYTPPPVPVEPTYPEPVLTDYTITLYETEKQCFGSAGCNVTFTVDLAYGGPTLDPAKTYELRYEVVGAEDPLLSTLEIQGENYTSTEQSVSTASESDELTATVLDIRER